jgi:Flp pilus assembly protein TadG
MHSSFRRLIRSREGVSAIEFAIILPVLLTILVGIFQFGTAMSNYLVLTNAAAKGALTLALSRGTTTPYTSTTAAITAAPNLTAANITTTVTVNGSTCSSDATCLTNLLAGKTATVKTTYPCKLIVMGTNYAPSGCTLSAQTAQMVQ